MEKTLRFSWKKSHEKLCRCHQSIGESHENHPLTVDLRPWQWWVTRFQPFDLEISFPRRGSVSWQGNPATLPCHGWLGEAIFKVKIISPKDLQLQIMWGPCASWWDLCFLGHAWGLSLGEKPREIPIPKTDAMSNRKIPGLVHEFYLDEFSQTP
jgi:hypothetical protein